MISYPIIISIYRARARPKSPITPATPTPRCVGRAAPAVEVEVPLALAWDVERLVDVIVLPAELVVVMTELMTVTLPLDVPLDEMELVVVMVLPSELVVVRTVLLPTPEVAVEVVRLPAELVVGIAVPVNVLPAELVLVTRE